MFLLNNKDTTVFFFPSKFVKIVNCEYRKNYMPSEKIAHYKLYNFDKLITERNYLTPIFIIKVL